MTCQCAPALLVLRDQVNAAFPRRDKTSDGCCGDAAHAARRSDHNPVGGYAHAYDFDEDFVQGMGDKPLWRFGLSLLADHRTKYMIYEAKILYPDGRIDDYHGINAHRHHLHLSIHNSDTFDTRPWKLDLQMGPAYDGKKDDMTDAQFQTMLAQLTAIQENTARLDNRMSNVEKAIDASGVPAVRTVPR